jgi:diaminohydroxyphosphoribosylaminopyrimidine deaminase / 5-amino-6-(5-phosphoribosylamino)uracil reductase
LISDSDLMAVALQTAVGIGRGVSPNPGVGAAIATVDGRVFTGHTQPPGGAHAEVVALRAAAEGGASVVGSTLATTLEPCSHTGRTGPCTEAIIGAGVARVIVGVADPDPLVAGAGVQRLRDAGVEVTLHTENDVASVAGVDVVTLVEKQLEFYLHHRRTGRPFVTLKLAASLDGRTAAPDHTSQWITSEPARIDAHRLRAEHDAILVGAGTVREDDPTLTVRHVSGPDPLRVVLGRASESAKVHPCLEMNGELDDVLDQLGARGVLSVLVEGGAMVAAQFHAARLVNRYVLYQAPVLFGGDDARGLFRGPGAPTISEIFRGSFESVEQVGPDLKVIIRSVFPS